MSTASFPEFHPISLATAGVTMSPEEFDAIVEFDDRYRYELVHGVLIVHAVPSEQESDPNDELGRLLRNYGESHPQGSALNRTLPERIVRTGENRRRPDRVIWAGLNRAADPINDVPAIVVEFVSVGRRDWRRDYIEKRQEYLDLGVREYWVIDRFERSMTVYRRATEGNDCNVVKDNETYRTEILPGFELPLSQLFDASDYWRGR